jgi:hypothetical protein
MRPWWRPSSLLCAGLVQQADMVRATPTSAALRLLDILLACLESAKDFLSPSGMRQRYDGGLSALRPCLSHLDSEGLFSTVYGHDLDLADGDMTRVGGV